MPRALLYAFLVLFPLFAAGGEITVEVRAASSFEGESSAAKLTATAAVTTKNHEPQTVALTVPGRATLDLPDGVWRLQVIAPGWFHAGDVITVRGNATASIAIWRLGTIQGRFETADKQPVSSLTARWSAQSGGVPSSETICAVDGAGYRCSVPVGTVDLKLQAAGYASQFLWQLKVPERNTLEVPVARFRRGGGVYGWVDVDRDVRVDRDRIRVVLRSTTTDAKPVTTTVNARGFFSFAGVDAGTYRLMASSDAEIASEAREVTVRQDRETELLEPLMLQRRTSLRVTIAPPLDPDGAQWSVTLSRAGEVMADTSGVATFPSLAPDTYELTISKKRNAAVFATRTVELPRDAELAMRIQTTGVVGRVRMKDSPLAAATVWVGGKTRVPNVALTTNADGEFSGVAPLDPDDTWDLTVSGSTPTVERTLRQKPVREDEHTVRLDLTLPAAAIEGTVVEASGAPAARGVVNVLGADAGDEDPMQARIGEGGAFEIVGLEAGKYVVYAEGSAGRTSERAHLDVGKDAVETIKLVLGAGLRLSGRLTTQEGGAVAGAKVFVTSVEVATPIWIPRSTSATGEFQTLLPDATRTIDVLVVARGFAFKAFRAPVQTDRQLTIVVRQNGGKLELQVPSTEDPSGRIPYLVHENTAIPLLFLMSNGVASVRDSDAKTMTVVAAQMDAGAYGLCLATPAAILTPPSARCTYGNLPPFGSLRLAIAAP